MSEEVKVRRGSLDDLTPDDRNMNKHTSYGMSLIEKSIRKHKFGRSILVDTGATNRKLGSDMGDAVTGGGLHGKDLSKADVSVNIYTHLQAQQIGKPVLMSCSIGDERVNGIPYADIVETAREYINALGGFERFAEWGLIR